MNPALVVSIIALVMATAGTGYAAISVSGASVVDGTLTGRDVKDRSLRPKELRRNSLGGAQIRESRLGTVPKAADAGAVDGIDSAELARGPVETSYGTGPAAIADPITQIDTAVGRFELDCLGGIQGADVRYRNSTTGAARVWRTYVLGNGTAKTLVDSAAPGEHDGLTWDDPNYSVIRVSQAGKVAELRTHSYEDGGVCQWDWELVRYGGA